MLNAIAILLAWVSLLGHIRGFKPMGSLLKKLLRIFYDMRMYVLVQVVVLIGFSLSFKVLLPGKTEFLNWYAFMTTFNMLVGMGEMEAFAADNQDVKIVKDNPLQSATTSLAHGLYIIYTVGCAIVMINMLIAQMSDSFDHVQEHEEVEALKERGHVLGQMLRYQLRWKRNDPKIFPDWLHVLTVREGVSMKRMGEEKWEGRLKKLQTKLRQSTNILNNKIDDNGKKMDQQVSILDEKVDKIAALDDKVDKMMALLKKVLAATNNTKIDDAEG